MPRVDYALEAEQDIVGIAEFIAGDNPEAALRWLQTIREACMTLATQPEMGELREGFGVPGCRSFSVGKYVIFFTGAGDGIQVARVVHGSRDMRNI